MPHQTGGIEYALETDTGNPAFIMEMRTGKCLTTIRWVKALGTKGRILILAPVTVLEAWQRELWLEGEHYSTCYGMPTEKRLEAVAAAWYGPRKRHWVLMNYEGLLSLGDVRVSKNNKRYRQVPGIAYLPWLAVCLDESPKIKNPNAQITKVCVSGFRQAQHRAILTGLPNPEGDLDLISQFLFLDGEFMGYTNFWEARNALFNKYGREWFHKKGSRARIKQYVHERGYVVTAEQAGMHTETVFQKRFVEPNRAQEKLYKQVAEEFAYTLADGTHAETNWKLVQQSWLQKISGGFDPENNLISSAKADELVNLLKGELGNRKVVVWFKFRHELEYAQERLTKAGISWVSIVGGESLNSRKSKLAQFRGNTRVLLATEKVAKYGTDCSVADTAIYYSNEWANEDRQQSLKRVVHPKKSRIHLIIDLVTRGTVDADVVELVTRKGITSRTFMSLLDIMVIERLKQYVKASGRSRMDAAKTRTDTRNVRAKPESKSAIGYATDSGSPPRIRTNRKKRTGRT
jgi:hypothetical protein